ncbi:hypothetical protein E2C01_062364 [Portunus trituberculatus]|uniref:Uncharacterized protein n=1 Tax=Portunus trituberculatus TaxID=210409 RepID=A0A5B7HFV2_PORTR|nr:hypothetical protein [Portunus trituberculatus]
MLVVVAKRRGAGASDLGDESCEADNLVNEIRKKVVSGTRDSTPRAQPREMKIQIRVKYRAV